MALPDVKKDINLSPLRNSTPGAAPVNEDVTRQNLNLDNAVTTSIQSRSTRTPSDPDGIGAIPQGGSAESDPNAPKLPNYNADRTKSNPYGGKVEQAIAVGPTARESIGKGTAADPVRGSETTTPSPANSTPSSAVVLSSAGAKVNPEQGKGTVHPEGTSATQYPGVVLPDGQTTVTGTDGTYKIQTQRYGGHSIVLDDGDGSGKGDHLTLKTRYGSTISLNDTRGLINISTGNGNIWMEFTKDGKLDIFAKDSVSIHTQNDFNFYADRDFNVHAKRDINFMSDNIVHFEAKENIELKAGGVSIQSDKTNIQLIAVDGDGKIIVNALTTHLDTKNEMILNAKPLQMNSKKALKVKQVLPYKTKSTWGGPESFISRVPMIEPWAGHEAISLEYKEDDVSRKTSSPAFTDAAAQKSIVRKPESAPGTPSNILKNPQGSTYPGDAKAQSDSPIGDYLSYANNVSQVVTGSVAKVYNGTRAALSVYVDPPETAAQDALNYRNAVTQYLTDPFTRTGYSVLTAADQLSKGQSLKSVATDVNTPDADKTKSEILGASPRINGVGFPEKMSISGLFKKLATSLVGDFASPTKSSNIDALMKLDFDKLDFPETKQVFIAARTNLENLYTQGADIVNQTGLGLVSKGKSFISGIGSFLKGGLSGAAGKVATSSLKEMTGIELKPGMSKEEIDAAITAQVQKAPLVKLLQGAKDNLIALPETVISEIKSQLQSYNNIIRGIFGADVDAMTSLLKGKNVDPTGSRSRNYGIIKLLKDPETIFRYKKYVGNEDLSKLSDEELRLRYLAVGGKEASALEDVGSLSRDQLERRLAFVQAVDQDSIYGPGQSVDSGTLPSLSSEDIINWTPTGTINTNNINADAADLNKEFTTQITRLASYPETFSAVATSSGSIPLPEGQDGEEVRALLSEMDQTARNLTNASVPAAPPNTSTTPQQIDPSPQSTAEVTVVPGTNNKSVMS